MDLVGNDKMKASRSVEHKVLYAHWSQRAEIIQDLVNCYGCAGAFLARSRMLMVVSCAACSRSALCVHLGNCYGCAGALLRPRVWLAEAACSVPGDACSSTVHCTVCVQFVNMRWRSSWLCPLPQASSAPSEQLVCGLTGRICVAAVLSSKCRHAGPTRKPCSGAAAAY